MITHRPVMGSFLNSGNDSSWSKINARKKYATQKKYGLFYYAHALGT
jgi:hypothetical protein